jgi:diguanylate cyclase (GGDEF)-like protein
MGPKKNSNPSRSFLLETLAKSNVRLQLEVANLERELAFTRHLAYHDPLTGLPNRALLLDRLQQALLQAERQDKAIGLLLLDLDCFKHVNDRLGHNAGDLVLRVIAQRLESCIRAGDTASRYGGDEFVILLPEIRGSDDVVTVAQKITASLSIPHQLGDETILVNGSLGTAVFDGGRASCDELIGAADSAMYRVKARSAGSLSLASERADVAA